MPEGSDRKLKDILGRPENQNLDAAEKRAKEIVDRAQLNEAIKIIEELETEVSTMHISNRFKRDAKPSESIMAGTQIMNVGFKGLTENEYKRQTLLYNLRLIKDRITSSVQELHNAVLDIEATKIDDKPPLYSDKVRRQISK